MKIVIINNFLIFGASNLNHRNEKNPKFGKSVQIR